MRKQIFSCTIDRRINLCNVLKGKSMTTPQKKLLFMTINSILGPRRTSKIHLKTNYDVSIRRCFYTPPVIGFLFLIGWHVVESKVIYLVFRVDAILY